jgi:hypothetical protein
MQKAVPDFARVNKSEYARLRGECQRTAKAAGFDWTDMWNLAIDELTKRHANVLKGRAKTELTLAEAVLRVQKKAVKVRMEMQTQGAAAVA